MLQIERKGVPIFQAEAEVEARLVFEPNQLTLEDYV